MAAPPADASPAACPPTIAPTGRRDAIIAYRVEHGVRQAELGRRVGMRQPHLARFDASEHEPSLPTLARLARALRIEFHVDITPKRLRITA